MPELDGALWSDQQPQQRGPSKEGQENVASRGNYFSLSLRDLGPTSNVRAFKMKIGCHSPIGAAN